MQYLSCIFWVLSYSVIMWYSFYLLFLLLQLSTYNTCSTLQSLQLWLWPQMDRLRRSLTLRVVDLKAARQLRRHLQGGGRHKVLQRVATATCHVAMTCTMLNLYELVALLLTPKAMSSLSNMNIPLVCMYMSSNCPRQWSSRNIWTGHGPGLKCAPTPRECRYYVFSQAGGVDLRMIWISGSYHLIPLPSTATWCDSAILVSSCISLDMSTAEILWDAVRCYEMLSSWEDWFIEVPAKLFQPGTLILFRFGACPHSWPSRWGSGSYPKNSKHFQTKTFFCEPYSRVDGRRSGVVEWKFTVASLALLCYVDLCCDCTELLL